MITHPGALLGLPAGLVGEGAGARPLIMIAIAVWAALVARGGRWGMVAGALVFLILTIGVGILSLGRPYGVLMEPGATRRAAQIATVASHGEADTSFVVGEEARPTLWVRLLTAAIPEEVVQLIPTFLVLLAPMAMAIAIGTLWARRDMAHLAVAVFALASNGSLEVLHGVGLVQEAWKRPESALAIPFVIAGVLGAGRLPGTARWLVPTLISGVWLAVGAPTSGPGPTALLLALTFDQAPLLVLGSWAVYRRSIDPAALVLWASGCALTLCAALGLRCDAWGGYAMQRVGLVLLATPTVSVVLTRLNAGIARRWQGWPRGMQQPAAAVLLLILAPGSFLAWWDPARLDPVAAASREPTSINLAPAMGWIRHHTPGDAVFLASPDYAPAVAVLGGRRILRAGAVMPVEDEMRRARAEGRILRRRPLPSWVGAYGVTHVFVAPGDFRRRGLDSPGSLGRRPGFRQLYADAEGFHVFAVDSGRKNQGTEAGSRPAREGID